MPDSATAKNVDAPWCVRSCAAYGMVIRVGLAAYCWSSCFTTSICLIPLLRLRSSANRHHALVRGTKSRHCSRVSLFVADPRLHLRGQTSSLSRVLYELVFLLFAILMIWVRRRRKALEIAIADRTAKLTVANEDLQSRKEQLDGLFELSPDAVILTDNDFHVLRVNKEFTRIFGVTQQKRPWDGGFPT